MARPVITFERCRPGEYRGVAPSGRCYWITNRHGGSRDWLLRCCENADADPRDVDEALYDGRLGDCRAEAQLHERERVKDDQLEAAHDE